MDTNFLNHFPNYLINFLHTTGITYGKVICVAFQKFNFCLLSTAAGKFGGILAFAHIPNKYRILSYNEHKCGSNLTKTAIYNCFSCLKITNCRFLFLIPYNNLPLGITANTYTRDPGIPVN